MLADLVIQTVQRGACMCGACVDAPVNPAEKQPTGHTADLVFFKVAIHPASNTEAVKKEFLSLAKQEYPHWFDGMPRSYLEIGADMGDQGVGLMTMGLGSLLGVWNLQTPETMFPKLDALVVMKMAGAGFITVSTK